MPVINASAGLADSLAKGVAQGTENFVDQRVQAEQRDTQRDQFDRTLAQRQAEWDIRRDERNKILQNSASVHTQAVESGGRVAQGYAVAEGFGDAANKGLDPANPMFWGYAGGKIALEVGRLEEEIQRFGSIVQDLPESAQRDLRGQTLLDFQTGILQKQDKLKRYGATSQINEWLAQHPEDADAFTPISDLVKKGEVTPEDALSQLAERKSEVAHRNGQIRAAQKLRTTFPQWQATLPPEVGRAISETDLELVAIEVENGLPIEEAHAKLYAGSLNENVVSSIALKQAEKKQAEDRAKATIWAREQMMRGVEKPPVENWDELTREQKEAVLIRYRLGFTPEASEKKPGGQSPRVNGKAAAIDRGVRTRWGTKAENAPKAVHPQDWATDLSSDESLMAMIRSGMTNEEIKAKLGKKK